MRAHGRLGGMVLRNKRLTSLPSTIHMRQHALSLRASVLNLSILTACGHFNWKSVFFLGAVKAVINTAIFLKDTFIVGIDSPTRLYLGLGYLSEILCARLSQV